MIGRGEGYHASSLTTRTVEISVDGHTYAGAHPGLKTIQISTVDQPAGGSRIVGEQNSVGVIPHTSE